MNGFILPVINALMQPDLFARSEAAQNLEDLPQASYFIEVLLPLPLSKCYSYLVPQDIFLQEGDWVEVSFGPRRLIGVVWRTPKNQSELFKNAQLKKMKYIERKIEAPSLPEKERLFLQWVASYTLAPLGALLKMSLSGADLKYQPKPSFVYSINADFDGKLSKRQKEIYAYLKKVPSQTQKALCDVLNTSSATLKKMIEKKALLIKEAKGEGASFFESSQMNQLKIQLGFELTKEQQLASSALIDAIDLGKHQTFFLDGVTGSGKTEVYFQAIYHAMQAGKQSLVLLPEIALSPAWEKRFEGYFGFAPAVWHSNISKAKKRHIWRAMQTGEFPVVLGARSALFLPFKNLGFIIIDEEHEGAYKQEEGTLYHARDMGIVKGYLSKAPVLLVSATPSLETYHHAFEGKYRRLTLTKRFGEATMPKVHIIDLLKEKMPPRQWLSAPLRKALAEVLEKREQAMLFLNRRGYSPLMLCRACGHRMKCAHCSAWMIWHKVTGRLHCHHCEAQELLPKHCPKCDEKESFAFCGPGVERIAEEVEALFPSARILFMTSDHMARQGAMDEALKAIEQREIDFIIGTQMIAKGHHFPNLTLVGVVDADLGLAGADPRATEKTYHLLHQVSGRAGREEKEGQVFIQTTLASHPLVEALRKNDRDAFLNYELENRRKGELPPFSKLAALIISSEKEAFLLQFCYQLSRNFPEKFLKNDGIELLGPAPAPIVFLRGRYRQRFLLKVPNEVKIQLLLKEWLSEVKMPRDIKIAIDIDPYSFF